MNKVEKLVSLLLGVALAWYVFVEMPRQTQAKADAVKASRETAAPAAKPESAPAQAPAEPKAVVPAAPATEKGAAPAVEKPSVPEKTLVLENGDVKLELSTWGAAVKKVVLKG